VQSSIDSPVAMDLQLIEADRITSPSSVMLPARNDVDGVILDSFGNLPAVHKSFKSAEQRAQNSCGAAGGRGMGQSPCQNQSTNSTEEPLDLKLS